MLYAPVSEPLLSKSLCSALLDMSAYLREHPDQTIRVKFGPDTVTVEAGVEPVVAPSSTDSSETVDEEALPNLFTGVAAPSFRAEKVWRLPLLWWPQTKLPHDFDDLLTVSTLPAALVQLRDEKSPFSVFVQESLSAEVAAVGAPLVPIMVALSAPRTSTQADVKGSEAPTQKPE